MPKRRIIILDANTLIYLVSGLSTIDDLLDAAGGPGASLATTEVVVEELRRLSKGRGLTARRASVALSLIRELGVEVLRIGGGEADDSIESAAVSLKMGGAMVYVATSDRDLRRRLRLRGVPTIYYRESSGRFEAEWEPI